MSTKERSRTVGANKSIAKNLEGSFIGSYIQNMLRNAGIIFFGLTEVIIGSFTLIAVIVSLLLGKSAKPPEVFIFVLTTAVISLILGIGILKRNLTSYHLLLFLSVIIILSKILIFAKIIFLSGALETSMPPSVKNIISIVYHSLLIWYFSRSYIRRQFGERRDALFSLRLPFHK